MKTLKTTLLLLSVVIASLAARATVLFEDSSNYPYANGCIEGQGQWYYLGTTAPQLDALVTNNILLLYSNHVDAVAAPTNATTGVLGWTNTDNPDVTYASFRVMVTQLPEEDGDDDYFCEFRNNAPTGSTNANSCCHVFIDTLNTSVPGTFRLGIANFDTEFGGEDSEFPPINYPQDLATNTWYTVVVAYGNNGAPDYAVGATLWINPSMQDYANFTNIVEDDAYSDTNAIGNYVYGYDPTSVSALLNINVEEIVFIPGSQSGSEGISNVIVGTEFTNVITTNLPVFGIQPLNIYTNSTETNYSGNNTKFYAVASGVDLTYQWYSANYGKLANGTTYANGDSFGGATNNTLIVSNLSLSDTYYCEVTDAYGNTATSSNAFEVVNTTPTPVFFPASDMPSNATVNVFQTINFYDPAKGTGPITYQWYFAPTNLPTTYSPLAGSNLDYVNLYLADYTFQGSYYVVASNSVNGGSIAFGPTNTIAEVAPTAATLQQLNVIYTNFLKSGQTLVEGTTYYLNQGGKTGTPITVGGYVTTYGVPIPGDTNLNGLAVGGLGNTYAEYYIQDTNGYGTEIYGGGETNNCQPPLGSYVTVSGLAEVYNDELELAPSSAAAVTVNPNAPPISSFNPLLANAIFNQLATNTLGTNALRLNDTLVTFTNVYFYSSRLGASISIGGYNYNGEFAENKGNGFYFTVGSPYNPTNPATGQGMNPALPINTNMLECYQFSYDYPYEQPTVVLNPFDNLTIPSYCYQLTGVYAVYGIPSAPEIVPSRVADYVINPPPAPTLTVGITNNAPTISWVPQVGSTYTVYSATNLLGPWTQAAYGLTYYPTNGAFTDTSGSVQAKFYQITSP